MRTVTCVLVLSALSSCADDTRADPTLPPPPPASETPPAVAPPATPVSDSVKLVDWVDDLLDHHTDDVSAPDTVDDKKIIDDESATTFDSRF